MIHTLKAWPAAFRAVKNGTKTHEIRVADRPYAVGDSLLLHEWDNVTGAYTGYLCLVEVTFITPGGEWGLPDNLCVMSIRKEK